MKADTLRKLAELNLDPAQMAGVLDILADMQEVEEGRRAAQRERVRKHREKHNGNISVTLHEGYTPPSSPIPFDPPSQTLPPIIPQTPSSTEPPKRAKRLADDWALPASWGRWALDEGWPEATIRLQADTFADFWRSKAGKDAAKLDWEATWRNWMRKVPKTAQRFNGHPRERTILDVIDERLDRANADIFDAFRTIDAEPSRREPSPPDLRLVADASRH